MPWVERPLHESTGFPQLFRPWHAGNPPSNPGTRSGKPNGGRFAGRGHCQGFGHVCIPGFGLFEEAIVAR